MYGGSGCVSRFLMLVFFFQCIMPGSSSKCLFSRDGKACHYDFSPDGHALCVPHRSCVTSDFVYDPEACDVCSEHIKFLRTVGHVDRLSLQFSSLKKSWEAVQRSAKRKGMTPAWRDPKLRDFV